MDQSTHETITESTQTNLDTQSLTQIDRRSSQFCDCRQVNQSQKQDKVMMLSELD
jgi:hypothetical protein